MVKRTKPVWNWENRYEHMNFKERFDNLDYKKIFKTLGIDWNLDFPAQDDPSIKIDMVLFQYCDDAFGPNAPSQIEKRAVIEELATRANALKVAISKTGKRSLQMLDWSLSKSKRKDRSNFPSISKAPIPDENDEPEGNVEFWNIYDSIEAFSQQLNDALASIAEPNGTTLKGRKPNTPLNDAIYGLAGIFEENVGQSAYMKFSIDEHGIASNSFMYFLGETLVAFDPLLSSNKAALGAAVRRLLSPTKKSNAKKET